MSSAGSGRRFTERRILVTGAASGIGRATAQLLVEEGARVALLDVNAAGLAETAQALGQWHQVIDLATVEDASQTVAAAATALGGLDGIANCAGVHKTATLTDTTLEDWRRTLSVNLTGPFLICQAALPWLKAGASIVNVASGMALLPDSPRATAYAASKGGLVAFSKALAAELAPAIRVNVVCPGLTATPMVNHILGGHADPSQAPGLARYALRRPADPREIAAAILFLLSDEASFITGAALAADGGRTFH